MATGSVPVGICSDEWRKFEIDVIQYVNTKRYLKVGNNIFQYANTVKYMQNDLL